MEKETLSILAIIPARKGSKQLQKELSETWRKNR